jgi:hypothetical protein
MLFSTFFLLSTLLAVNAVTQKKCHSGKSRTTNKTVTADNYVQHPSGSASFTVYTDCGSGGDNYCSHPRRPVTELFLIIACGKATSGFTAAMNQLAFGAPPGGGPGDACGRCFSLTGTGDPYSPYYAGPFYSIVVKVTDLW